MQNSVEKFNALNGNEVSKEELLKLMTQAFDEQQFEVHKRLTTLLGKYPEAESFILHIAPFAKFDETAHGGMGKPKKAIEKVKKAVKKTKRTIARKAAKMTNDFEETPEHYASLGIPCLSEAETEALGNEASGGLGKAITNNDVYQMVTDKLIKSIEENGNLPWYHGRDSDKGKGEYVYMPRPFNPASNTFYRGINALILSSRNVVSQREVKGKKVYVVLPEPILDDKLAWLTFKQIEALGGKLKKGSKSSEAVFYSFVYKFNDKTISEEKYRELHKKYDCKTNPKKEDCKGLYRFSFLRYYNVFNEADITGIDFEAYRNQLKAKSKQLDAPELKIEAAEAIFKNMPDKPKLIQRHIGQGESPHYNGNKDEIVMPLKKQYDNTAIWYGTLFHESIHATGHRKRLDRDSLKDYHLSTEIRAFEELIAEIGSAFLNAESGIFFHTLKKNTAYIKGWVKHVKKMLKKDNKAIFKASGAAQKAADFILDKDKNGVPKFYGDISTETKSAKGKPSKKQKEAPQLALFGRIPKNPTVKSALEYAEKHIIGTSIYHQDIGQKIVFTRGGIKKAVNGRGRVTRSRIQLVFIAKDLLKKARLYSSESDLKNRKNVHLIYKLRTTAVLDGKRFEVLITLQAKKNGIIYYDHAAIKLKRQFSVPGEKSEPLERAKLSSGSKEHNKNTKNNNTKLKKLGTVLIDVVPPTPAVSVNEGSVSAVPLVTQTPQVKPIEEKKQEAVASEPAQAVKKPKAKNRLMDMTFDTIEMDEGWEEFMQHPAANMKVAIWGKPKNGKTSGALKLAKYLTRKGRVLYNFADQGFNKSTQDLWRNSGLAESQNAEPSDIETLAELEAEIKRGNYRFVFIDMINDYINREKISPQDFKDRFIKKFPNTSFILVFEVTKNGDFKGDQGWTHVVDAIVTVENFLMENRGRYGVGHHIIWEEGFKRFNPKKYEEIMGETQTNTLPDGVTI